MPSPKIAKPQSAPIVRQGQTADGRFGSNPDKQARGAKQVRDLKAKG